MSETDVASVAVVLVEAAEAIYGFVVHHEDAAGGDLVAAVRPAAPGIAHLGAELPVGAVPPTVVEKAGRAVEVWFGFLDSLAAEREPAMAQVDAVVITGQDVG